LINTDIKKNIEEYKHEIQKIKQKIEELEQFENKDNSLFERLEYLYHQVIFNIEKLLTEYSNFSLLEFDEKIIEEKINFQHELALYFEKYLNITEKLKYHGEIHYSNYLKLNNLLYEDYENIRNQIIHDNPTIRYDFDTFEKEIKPNFYKKFIDNLDKAINSLEQMISDPKKKASDKNYFYRENYEVLGDLYLHKALLIKDIEADETNYLSEVKKALDRYNQAINFERLLKKLNKKYLSYKKQDYMRIFNNFLYIDKLGNLKKITNLVDKKNHVEKKFKIWEKLTYKRFDTKPLKGMKDFYPQDLRLVKYILSIVDEVAELYGYEEFESPLLEPLEIFAAKSSRELVNEQSFYIEKFEDQKIILIPELTPSLARMVAAKFQELKKPIKWFSVPTCFRWEQPQRGRLRSFKQVNFDILGEDSLYAELEIFNIIINILTGLNATSAQFQIYYNSRRFIDALCDLVIGIPKEKMPLVYKILDKSDKMEEQEFEKYVIDTFEEERIIQGILKLKNSNKIEDLLKKFDEIPPEFYESKGYEELKKLENLIEISGISEYCSFSSNIVRGLDYYTGVVFEVFDTGEKNRRAIFGGGRYDDLLSLFSDEPLSGIGFGMGVLIVQLFLETYGLLPPDIKEKDYSDTIYITCVDESVADYALQIARLIRKENIPCIIDYRFGGLKNQLKKASDLGVLITLIIGPKEKKQNKVSVRNMTTEKQTTIVLKDLISEIFSILEEQE